MAAPSLTTPDPKAVLRQGRLSCLQTDFGGATSITAVGELDSGTAPRLDSVLRSAEADAALLYLDMHALELMDASGAQLLLAAQRRIRLTGGRLLIGRAPAQVEWLLALVGIDRRLTLADQPPAPSGARAVPA